ncbi:MAG: DUF3108 domain-containing protein [Paracoccaceae bacterium]
MLPRFALVGLLLFTCAMPTVAQESQTARYTLSISGLTAGKMTLGANHGSGTYAVSANTASAGLAGLFRSFSLTSRVRGTEQAGRLVPASYTSRTEGSREGRGADLSFKNGIATVLRADAPSPDAPPVDPAQHKGAVDPLTGLYAILRDTTPARACRLTVEMFDGHRISRLSLSAPKTDGDSLTCQGLYQRVEGYPPDEIAKRAEFPFVVTYTAVGDGTVRAIEVSMDSLFGPARLTRDD